MTVPHDLLATARARLSQRLRPTAPPPPLVGVEREVVEAAEREAVGGEGNPVDTLRALGLEAWARTLWAMPDARYPALSALLPAMVSPEVQGRWAGWSGEVLLQQSVAFVRYAEMACATFGPGPLQSHTLTLDFGCGYGRLGRLLMRRVGADALWGADPADDALAFATQGTFRRDRVRLTDEVPDVIAVPQGEFGLIVAFSVFTHLSPHAAAAALRALRGCVSDDGVLVLTIRPREFWSINERTDESSRQVLEATHDREGVAFRPLSGSLPPLSEANFGDTTWTLPAFERLAEDWRLVDVDRAFVDPYQLVLTLRPVTHSA